MQTVQLSNEKCARHSQRYCPEPGCFTPLVPNTSQPAQSPKPGFEDQLVGRTEQSTTSVPKAQAEKPQMAETQKVPESQATALVEASQTYADAVSVSWTRVLTCTAATIALISLLRSIHSRRPSRVRIALSGLSRYRLGCE